MVQCLKCGNANRTGARFCSQCGALLVNTAPLALGTVVHGRYEVIGLLGKGGMGAVYQVQDQRVFGKRWALKELVNTFADPADWTQAIQQFESEAKMLVSLNHPNLPQIADFFSEGGRQYLVMEFVEGETLEAILGKTSGFLAESVVLEWAAQLCDVLSYLHEQKPNPVIFRDLKPDNIMLASNGTIKLIDFGIARIFDPAKKTDTLKMGTIGYAPPEQYAGHGQTDARSDIYALGVTLHRLLTRHDPSTKPFVLPRPDLLNNRISQNTVRVILRATETDPDRRYQSAAAMKADLLPTPAKISPSPGGAASSPRMPRVFVANAGDGTITVIDPITNTVQSALSLSQTQKYPSLGPIASTENNKLCVILHTKPQALDLFIWEFLDSFDLQYHSSLECCVVSIDISTLREEEAIRMNCRPRAMATYSDSKIIVTGDNGAHIVDLGANNVHLLNIKEKLTGIASIIPIGKTFVAAEKSNQVFVIDNKTHAVMSVIKVGSQPSGMVVAPDNTVWVAHWGEPKVLGIDENTHQVKFTIQMAKSFFGPSGFLNLAATSNGKVYATTGSGNTIFVADVKTGTFISQLQVGKNPTDLVVSDQGMVYVTCPDDNIVAVIDSTSDKVVATIGVGRKPSYIVYG